MLPALEAPEACSSLAHASLVDLVVLCMFTKCSGKDAWRDICSYIWPGLLFMLGTCLEKCAHKLAFSGTMEPAPLLKSKGGHSKRIPLGNKVLLLKKLRKSKSHRRLIMASHGELVPSTADLVTSESVLECQEYLGLLEKSFGHCSHLQVSWDPSCYSGEDVLVSTIWSHQAGVVGYLPIQFMLPASSHELDDEIKVLATKKTITRVSGFVELRALAHALVAVNKHLDSFLLPDDLAWKPLTSNQERELDGAQFWVVDRETGARVPQIPRNFSVQDQPILVSWTDQGSVNSGVLDYVVYHLGLCILVGFDRQHRTYNDLKSALKAASLFRSFLACTLIFNLNFAPMGSKAWFAKKRAALESFLKKHSPHRQPFLSYMHNICTERMEHETGEAEQRTRMWQELASMRSCQVHGPLAKLMRWYSWWECDEFYKGEVWMTRLIMLHTTRAHVDEDNLDTSFEMPEGLTPKEEIAHLKKKTRWVVSGTSFGEQTNHVGETGNCRTGEATLVQLFFYVKACEDMQGQGFTLHCFKLKGFHSQDCTLVSPFHTPAGC